jgi:3-isopropylmalate/(R)-2-methylmalate dehydratase small subunit
MATGLEITLVNGRGLPYRKSDTDTDRILPARFLKETTFERMGEYFFIDEREAEGDKHPLNNPAYKGSTIFFAGRNFGCGSSREHAPQGLKRYGFNAVVAPSFAEIFAGNCVNLGVPAVSVPQEGIDKLFDQIEQHPETEFAIDLQNMVVTHGGVVVPCEMPKATREALLKGTWNALGLLKLNMPQVEELAARLPYASGYRS